jgi:2-dehydropantoate 2-reductase
MRKDRGMRLAVIGAGAVGSLVGGLLARAGEDVTLVGRQPHVDAVKRDGLRIDGELGPLQIRVGAIERLDFKPDVALLTVKTQAVADAARE